MPLNMRLVSAGKITDSLGREWDPIEHPRGRDGRFIRVFKLIHMFLNSQDSDPWGTAQVTQINPNGSVRAKVTAVADPKWNDRIGHEVDLLPGSIESLNEKASLAEAKSAVGNATVAASKYDFSSEKMHDFFLNAGLGTDTPGDLSYAVKAAEDLKSGNVNIIGPRAKYHLALYAKSISGGDHAEGPSHTDDEFMDLLEELGVDPKIVDDTPDGMSGVKVLADAVNVNASPNTNKPDSIDWFDEIPPLAPGTIREARLRNSDIYVRWYADGKQSVVWPDGTEKQHDKNKGSLLLAAHEANQTNGVSPDANIPSATDLLEPPNDVIEPDVQKKFEVLDDPGKSGDGYYNAPGSKLWGKYGAAGVMIRHTDENGVERFLMVQRGPMVSSNKGKWQLPGGALNSNENDYQGTARELVEELSPPDGYLDGLAPVGEFKLEHPSGWHYTNITADSPEQFEPKVDGTETGAAGWFTKEEIANLPLHPALASNLDSVFGTFHMSESSEEQGPLLPDDDPNVTLPVATAIEGDPLTEDEIFAFNVYGGSKFLGGEYQPHKLINNSLRNGIELDDSYKKVVQNIDAVMARSKAVEDVVLYRGMQRRGKNPEAAQKFDEMMASLVDGAIIEDLGFVSTSKKTYTAKYFTEMGAEPDDQSNDKIVMRIHVPAGASAYDLSAHYKTDLQEHEVLLPRGTKLRVSGTIKTEGDFKVLDLEVVNEGPDAGPDAGAGADAGVPGSTDLGTGPDHHYAPGEKIDATQWEQVGGQGGSNTGGLFKDEQGNQWYVKNQKSETHAKNESLAAALYEAAGISSAPQILADTKWGPNGTASPWIENTKDFSSKRNDPAYRKKVQEGFAFDAWIANWDTMGLVWDNIVSDKDGNPLRVDPGGALYFRAQGKPKGAFGDEVNELVTFKDQSNNAGKVFHDIDAATELASAQKVIDISPEKIDELVDAMNFPSDGPFDGEFMKKTLKARRVFIADHYGIPLPESEATPDPIPEDITDADLPDGFSPIESSGPAIDYIDKHSIYFFDPDTQDDIAELGGYHAENAYGKLAAYFADVQDADVEFNSEVADKLLDDIIAGLEVDYDTQSEVKIANYHVKKLVAMRNDLIPFENKKPEPDTSLNIPGPESTDWQNMVDDQGPYRWGFGGQKLRVGDQVVSKNDGITGVIHSFEKNHKGIVVKTPDGKKKARKNDTLALVTNNATPEPTPAAHTPEITTHDENGESSIETQLLAWWDKAADGDKFAFNSADGLTYYFELDAKNDQMHFKDPGGDTIESWYANPDKGIDMDKLVDSAYLLQHPPANTPPRVPNADNVTYDELAQSIQTNTEELAYFNDTYSNDYGGYVGNIVAETRHDFENGKISAQAAANIVGTLYHEFAQKNENGDDNGLPDSAVEALYELANDYYEIDKVSPVDDTSPDEVYTGIAPLFDDNLGEFLGKYGKYSPEQNGKSLQDLLNEDISELESGSLSQADFIDALHTYADQLQESGQVKPANDLLSVIKSAPESDNNVNTDPEMIPGVDKSLSNEIDNNELDTAIDNFIADIPTGDIFDKQEYNLPGGYTLGITEPDEDGDGHITLQDSHGDNLESWTYGWASYVPEVLKTEIQDVIKKEEGYKKPKDPNAPDPWSSEPPNSADPNGHSKASAVIEHLIDDWQTGDIFDGKNVNLPYGLSFRFTDNDSDPVNYTGPKFQVVDAGNGEVVDEWPAMYAEKNVEGVRTYVEAILDHYKNESDTADAKKSAKGMFSPPDDMDGALGDGDLMEWMIGEHNEKLDNVLTQIQHDTGAEFEADAGDIYDVLTGNQDPNKYPQYAIAAIAAADHLHFAGALDQGDMETLYNALGIPGSFYADKKPHEIIQAIKSGKGFGTGDDKNVGTLGPVAEIDNELAEWEKELLWNAPTQVDGAHQPDSIDAAKIFLSTDNPPVGVQLKFTGYNWTLSYELDGTDKPVYVLRDQDSAIHAAWDPSDVTPDSVDLIASDIWTKMHANDVYDDNSSPDLPYSTLENDDPTSNGFIAPNATPEQVNSAVDQFVKNVHGKIVFNGDYLSLPDDYKLKFVIDGDTPLYRLFDGDDIFINEWDFDENDLVNDISLSIQEEIPSLGLSSGKKTPVGNAKIDYNGNTYDTPPTGFKVHAVSTTSQDVVLVEHPNGDLFQYYVGGGHDYVGQKSSLPNFIQNTNAWKPAPGAENSIPDVGKPEDINGFISEIPPTIYGVKTLFPSMTDYQAKQYRNAHYALSDAKYDTPLSAEWQKHIDKAKYNLQQAGPDALPTLEKLKKWEMDVKGITIAPEPEPAPGSIDLGPGFAKVPAGHTPKYIWSDGTAVAVQKPNGAWTYFFNDGSTHEVAYVDEADIVNNPSWAPYVPASSAPSTSNTPDSTDETDQGDPAVGDISVAVGSTVSKFYGHDYTKQADGTWTSPTNPIVIDADSPAADALNDHVKNPGIPVPKGDPGTTGEYRVDANGNVMRIGDTVQSTTDGLTGFIASFENNDKGVVVIDPDGKPRHRHRLKLKNVDPNAAPPKKPEVMPSAKSSSSPDESSITWTPPTATAEVDPTSPWFEQPKPTAPSPPADMGIQYVSDAWMAQADANYKKRMKAKNSSWTEKDLSQSSTYGQFKNVQENGDIKELDTLLNQGRITPEMHADAKAQIQKNEIPVKEAQAKYDADLQQYTKDVLAWNKANGVVWGAFPGAPAPATEPFTGGEADWTKAPLGTPAAKSVMEAMSKADTALAVRGSSFSFDSDQIEDLDVRVMRVLDVDGTEKLEMKFKLTAWAGDDLKNKLSSDPKITTTHGISLNDRKIDSKTGLPKYLDAAKYSGSGTTWTYTDPETGARVEVTRDGSSTTGVHATTLHNQVRVFMPAGSTAEDFQKTMENLGIKKSTPATAADLKAYAENKLISVFGGQTDPTKNLSLPAARAAKLAEIEQKYGVTLADLRLGTNGKGRTKLFLSDAARDKMIAYANVKGFKHNFAHGNDVNRWKSVLVGENNGLLSTHSRWSEGVSGSGMSSSSDMGSGAGGDFIYTRVMHSHDNHAKNGSYIVLHPKAMMRRTDVYSNPSDNGTGKHYDNQKAYDIMQGNPYEVVWKHGIPVDEMYYVVVPSTIMRDELITYMHSKGITHINGIPIEQFILTGGMPVPVMDESQWSSENLPPAIGAVQGGTP